MTYTEQCSEDRAAEARSTTVAGPSANARPAAKARLSTPTVPARIEIASGGNANAIPFSRRPAPENIYRLRAVHYFQDDWPYTFWDNLDLRTVDQELAEIRGHGFNTIIVFLAWGKFQTHLDPPTYDEQSFAKLDALIEAARRQGLWVIARVGTPEHVPADLPGGDSYKIPGLMFDPDKIGIGAINALIDETTRRLAKHENVYGVFRSWEDMCEYIHLIKQSEPQRRAAADRQSQFQAYLKARGPLERWNSSWGTDYRSFEEIPVPGLRTTALLDYIEFIKHYISVEILSNMRVADGVLLGYEIRVDSEPAVRDGQPAWCGYLDAPLPETVDFIAAYYNPFWATSNNGGFITPEQAVTNCEHMVGLLQTFQPGRPIFFDQLNLADDTPSFTRVNSKLRYPHDEARAAELIVPMLFQRTVGYSLWTYKDYAGDVVLDGTFRAESSPWRKSGPTEPVDDVLGRPGIRLGASARLVQDLKSHFNPGNVGGTVYRFDVRAGVENAGAGPQILRVTVRDDSGNEASRRLEIRPGEPALYEVAMPELIFTAQASLTIEAEASNTAPIVLTRPRIWNHVMATGLIDRLGFPYRSRCEVYGRLNREWERYEDGKAVPARAETVLVGRNARQTFGIDHDGWASSTSILPLYLPFGQGSIFLEIYLPEEDTIVDQTLHARWEGADPDRQLTFTLQPGHQRLEIPQPGSISGRSEPGDRVLFLRADSVFRVPGDDRDLSFLLVRCGTDFERLELGEPTLGRRVHSIEGIASNRVLVSGHWIGEGVVRVTFNVRGHRSVIREIDSDSGPWQVALPLWLEDLHGRPELYLDVEPLSGSGTIVVEAIEAESERTPNLIYQ
ncbi:hypothetical protein BH23PLA1_BH23PLA1_12150 [soil metagenome]